MRVAIIGLGGVGGYMGASLAKSSCDVVGFARGEHLRTIKKNGIKIIEDDLSWNTPLEVKELHEAEGYFDLVLFCVKSYDLQMCYEQIQHTLDEKSILLSFSNGVANGDLLRKISNSIVLDGCVYILSHIQEAGVIRKKAKVFAAVFGGELPASAALKSIFEKAHLRVKTPEYIQEALWRKYIFIAAFAMLTSYYDKSIGYLYKNHYCEAEAVLKEIAKLAKAKGINIENEVQKSLDIAQGLPYDSSTSMHLDFQKKKPTELESLSGYIVQEAEIYNVDVPQITKMYKELSLH